MWLQQSLSVARLILLHLLYVSIRCNSIWSRALHMTTATQVQQQQCSLKLGAAQPQFHHQSQSHKLHTCGSTSNCPSSSHPQHYLMHPAMMSTVVACPANHHLSCLTTSASHYLQMMRTHIQSQICPGMKMNQQIHWMIPNLLYRKNSWCLCLKHAMSLDVGSLFQSHLRSPSRVLHSLSNLYA